MKEIPALEATKRKRHPKQIRVSVTFDMWVDPTKRFNIANLVAPLTDEIVYKMMVDTTNRCVKRDDWDVNTIKGELELSKAMDDPAFAKELAEAKHNQWLAEKEAECRRLYDLSWSEFSNLNYDQQRELQKKKHVVRERGKLVRKPRPQVCDEV